MEGTKRNADNFMNWIKAVSWGDVPSFQSTYLLAPIFVASSA